MKLMLTISVERRGWTDHYTLGPVSGSTALYMGALLLSLISMGVMLAWRV